MRVKIDTDKIKETAKHSFYVSLGLSMYLWQDVRPAVIYSVALKAKELLRNSKEQETKAKRERG